MESVPTGPRGGRVRRAIHLLGCGCVGPHQLCWGVPDCRSWWCAGGARLTAEWLHLDHTSTSRHQLLGRGGASQVVAAEFDDHHVGERQLRARLPVASTLAREQVISKVKCGADGPWPPAVGQVVGSVLALCWCACPRAVPTALARDRDLVRDRDWIAHNAEHVVDAREKLGRRSCERCDKCDGGDRGDRGDGCDSWSRCNRCEGCNVTSACVVAGAWRGRRGQP